LKSSRTDYSIDRREFFWILLPLALFAFWSFASTLWASSARAALHHSLVWAGFFIFYGLVRRAVTDDTTRAFMIRVLTAVILAISVACLLEYVLGEDTQTKTYNERYYSYAEIFAALIPLLTAYGLRANRKAWLVSSFTVVAMWTAILATTSRAMLIAASIGSLAVILLTWTSRRSLENSRRWIVVFTSLALVTLAFLVPTAPDRPSVIVQRFSGNEKWSAESARSRLLYWGLAVEGFRGSPVLGIGADNYFTDYRNLREMLATRDPEDTILEINEDSIPERAHNEYLQILSELGIVGAIIFLWLICGVAYMALLAYRTKASLLVVGALAGMSAFFVASAASSYSFRFVGNGLCFFFLLAIAASKLFDSAEPPTSAKKRAGVPAVHVFGILIAVATLLFCIVRAESIRRMTNALLSSDEATKFVEIERAIAIDPSEPMFRMYFGRWLTHRGDYDRAAPELRFAIDNGLANSTSFFVLAATHSKRGHEADAEDTLKEALRVFPRSVFLRTAYSSFLMRAGRNSEAEDQFQKALAIDEKQARSWQLAHMEGLERLVQTAVTDDRYVSPFGLKPEAGPLALVQFQQK
jgi:O-antigen ligase